MELGTVMDSSINRDAENLSDASNSILNYKSEREKKFEDELEVENAKVAKRFAIDKKFAISEDILRAFDDYYSELQERLSLEIGESAKDYYHLKNSSFEASDVLEAIQMVVHNSLNVVLEKLNAQTAAIFILNKNGVLERLAMSGYDLAGNSISAYWYKDETYKVEDASFVGGAAVSRGDSKYGTPQYSSNLDEEKNLSPGGKQKYTQKCGPLRSAIAIPINGRSKTYGVLRVINRIDDDTKLPDPKAIFDRYEDVVWLSLLATIISNILSNFKHDFQLKTLEHFHGALSGTPKSLKNFYLRSVDLLVLSPETLFKAAVLRVLDSETGSLQVVSTSLFSGVSQDRNNSAVKIGDGLAGWVAQNEEPLILPRIRFNDDFVRFRDRDWVNQPWIRKNGFQAFGCFPLVAKETLLGTLSFYTGCAYDFQADINGFTFIKNVAELLSTFILYNSSHQMELNEKRIQSLQERVIFLEKKLKLDTESLIKDKIIQEKRDNYQYDILLLDSSFELENKLQKISQALIDEGILPWISKYDIQIDVDKKTSIDRILDNVKFVAICVNKADKGPWNDPQKRAFLRGLIKRGVRMLLLFIGDFDDLPQLPVFLEDLDSIKVKEDFDTELSELIRKIGGETPYS